MVIKNKIKMKKLNRKQTILELQDRHMEFKAMRVVRKFIKNPLTKPNYFKGQIARAFLETWSKTKQLNK